MADDEAYNAAKGAGRLKEFRHELGTHWALVSLLAEQGYPASRNQTKSLAHQVAQLLGGHHGCFADVVPARMAAQASQYQAGLGERGWEEPRVMGAGAAPAGELSAATAVRLHGLVVLADWLASRVEWIKPLMPTPDGQVRLRSWTSTSRRRSTLLPEGQILHQVGSDLQTPS